MSLLTPWALLSKDFDDLSNEIRIFVIQRKATIAGAADFSLADECFLEGALSRCWQVWCVFCRSVVCQSCLGTTRANGTIISAHVEALTEAHVAGAAKKAKSTNNPPTWGSVQNVLRNEITWGDTDVLATILPLMAPQNAGQLLAAFSQAHRSAKNMQTIRNAAAHSNAENFAAVIALSSRFVTYHVTHPVQALFWTEPSSGNFIVLEMIEDLRDNAFIAIS